jgi:putative transposase
MEQTLTLVCKIQPTFEQVAKIEVTLQRFAEACNYTNQTVKPSVTNKVAIQSQVYEELRNQFDLSANLAVRVCARVAANRKTAKQQGKPVKEFEPTSADYDSKIFSFREKDWTVSLNLVGGRERIPLGVANYQMGKLKGRNPTSAQLCEHRNGLFHLHIQLTDETPEPIKSNKVIGVDFGRRDIAVTSTGEKWNGAQITQVRDHFAKVRASLQRKASKGTRSTRRRARQILQRLSGRERRYQTWLNHNISKAIILMARSHNAAIAIEDLTGIRERTNQQPRNRTERRRSNSWAFFQLRLFLSYKSLRYGAHLLTVPPAYTSQTCHQCLHIGHRSGKSFKCVNEQCGWHGDADDNGSKVIERLGGCYVNQPGGSWLSCLIADDWRATESPVALCAG